MSLSENATIQDGESKNNLFLQEKSEFFRDNAELNSNLADVMAQNTIGIKVEDLDIDLGKQLLLNFSFGLKKAYDTIKSTKVKRTYNLTYLLATAEDSAWIVDRLQAIVSESDETEVNDLEDVDEHDSDTVEYSALAVKKLVATECLPKYVKRISEYFDRVAAARKKTRLEEKSEAEPYYILEKDIVIGYSQERGTICINLNWFAALLKKPYNPETSGIQFDSLEDALFFAGVEEAAHYVYYSARETQPNESE